MLRTELLERAKSALRAGTSYRLGAGAPPSAPSPADSSGSCDCSGYLCWVLHLSRHQPDLQFLERELGHYWLSTDGIVCDARNPTGFFYSIPSGAMPEPGDIIVYPGNYYARKIGWKGRGPQIGHVGILVGPEKVIHCSSGNMRKFGDAIAITDLGVFTSVPYTKVVRFSGVV